MKAGIFKNRRLRREGPEEIGELRYEFKDRVKKRVESLGILPPPRPTMHKDHIPVFQHSEPGDYFDGRLPTVIRNLSFDQLSSLHSLFTSWFSYVAYQAELAAVERSEAKRQSEYISSTLRQIFKDHPDTGEKTTVQERADLAKRDGRFVEADLILAETEAKYDLINTAVRIAEQDLKTISREITIKQAKEMNLNKKTWAAGGSERPYRSRFSREEDDGTEEFR